MPRLLCLQKRQDVVKAGSLLVSFVASSLGGVGSMFVHLAVVGRVLIFCM